MKKLLTPREHEILKLIYANMTNEEIAGRIHISLHTVKVHNMSIFKKLKAKNRLQAIVNALRLGILEL